MFEWIVEVKRECGFRSEGGMYLKTAEGGPNGVLAAFSVIDPPIPVQRKPHRGPLLVNKEMVLGRYPEETWYIGTSAKTQETNRANEAWEDVFGMPLYRRLDTGDCAGAETAEEAYERLIKQAKYGKSLELSVRQLSLEGWQDKPNMAGLYSALSGCMFRVAATGEAKQLVKIGALAWSMFYQLPPSKRNEASSLARVLASIGFVKDGREMLTMANSK